MVMHHHLTNPWEVASFFCSASDHGMQTRFGGRLSRVEGGLKAALHDAATPHHTTPPAMSIKLPSRSRTYRQAVPSYTAARQYIESLPTCRLPYGVFVQRTTTPRFSKIGDRKTLANAAAVLDHLSQTSMCTIFSKKQRSFSKTGTTWQISRPVFIVPCLAWSLPSYHRSKRQIEGNTDIQRDSGR